MKPLFNKIFLLLFLTFLFTNCSSDEESEVINYPVVLSYKGEESSTLEYWKGGSLVENLSNISIDKLYDYFSGFTIGEDDPTENDLEIKSLVIQFLDNNTLKISNLIETDKILELEYEFKADTLKVTTDEGEIALGIGNRNQIKIFYNISKFKEKYNETDFRSSRFSSFYNKFNFYDVFPLNYSFGIGEFTVFFKTPTDMGTGDEVIFFNKEYILRK